MVEKKAARKRKDIADTLRWELPLPAQRAQKSIIPTEEDLANFSSEERMFARRSLASANDRLEEEKRRLSDLFEFAPDGYVVTDRYGAILELNVAAVELLNLHPSIARKKPLAMFIDPKNRKAFRLKLAEIARQPGNTVETMELGIKPLRRNTIIPAALRVGVILNSAGRVSALRWLLRDISEHKKMIEALRHSETLLAQRKRELEAINGLILAVGTSLDLGAILDTVSDVMQHHLGIAAGAVLLYQESADRNSLNKTWGLSTKVEKQLQQATGAYPEQQTELTIQLEAAFNQSVKVHLASIKSVTPQWKQCLLIQLWGIDSIKGLIYLFSTDPLISDERQAALYRAVGQQVGAAVQNAHLYEETLLRQAQLQYVSKQLVEAQETERRNVARELHDEIGQSLTGLKLFLEANAARGENSEKAVNMVNELIGQVRNMSLNLRPSMLDDLGVLPTLLWFFRRYTAQTGVKVGFQHSAIDQRFGAETETAVYRIVQEALTNVARYAGVKEVSVCLELSDECLNISVDDEGQGFDMDALRGTYRSAGLSSMVERALALGGQLRIDSEPGFGVHIRACLPVAGEPVAQGEAVDAVTK